MDHRRNFYRCRLRWLLALFIPLSIVLALYSRTALHRKQRADAYDRMNRLGMDAHFENDGDCILFFKNGNVTDSDLKSFGLVFRGEARMGSHKVIRVELFDSDVSEAAVTEFRRSVQNCELIP
jgi:hypothetical protein